MKLFLIVRGDLSHGARAAQLCHAMRSFVDEHPAVDREWFLKSNTLVLLEVPDEPTLAALAFEARTRRIPVSVFTEPDMGDQMTAIAVGPSGRKLVRRLPLAFQDAVAQQVRAAGF